MFENGEDMSGSAIERGFAGEIKSPDEIGRDFFGLGIFDLSPEDSYLVVMLADCIRDVALADHHVSREFKTPVEAIRDFAATAMRHQCF